MSTYELDDALVRDFIDQASQRERWPALQKVFVELVDQLPVPTTEPGTFGAIVRAGVDGLSDRVLWQRGPKGGWTSEEGAYTASYEWLHNPEVVWAGV